MNTSKFNYHSNETKQIGGTKLVRKVSIRNGKGLKSVTKYRGGKKIGKSIKSINRGHIELIKLGKFIPGLFLECKCREKTLKNKK